MSNNLSKKSPICQKIRKTIRQKFRQKIRQNIRQKIRQNIRQKIRQKNSSKNSPKKIRYLPIFFILTNSITKRTLVRFPLFFPN